MCLIRPQEDIRKYIDYVHMNPVGDLEPLREMPEFSNLKKKFE